jgi:hypothetical protein
MNLRQTQRPVDLITRTFRPATNWFQRSPARSEVVEAVGSWRPEHSSAARVASSGDLFSFTAEERSAHYRRSLRATLATFAAMATLFALFFGLIAACGGL